MYLLCTFVYTKYCNVYTKMVKYIYGGDLIKTENIILRVEPELKSKIIEMAEKDNRNVSSWILNLVKNKIDEEEFIMIDLRNVTIESLAAYVKKSYEKCLKNKKDMHFYMDDPYSQKPTIYIKASSNDNTFFSFEYGNPVYPPYIWWYVNDNDPEYELTDKVDIDIDKLIDRLYKYIVRVYQ